MATVTTGSSISVRFQRLQECIHAALNKSRSRVDVELVVRQCYGDEGNNEVFQALLDGMLTKMHADVTADMARLLKEQEVESRLVLLESVISKLERQAVEKEQAAETDKESTERAIRSATLPLNTSAQDYVRIQTYGRMMKEKIVLRDEIETLENEIAQLKDDRNRNSENVDLGVSEMKAVKGDLEKTADVCSLLS